MYFDKLSLYNGLLGVHTRCTLAGWLDVWLCECHKVTQLCNEIRNIKKRRPSNSNNVLNKDTTINIVSNNTPDQAQDICERDDLDDDKNEDNKLYLDLPTYSQDNRTRYAPPPPLNQTEYGGTPPAPLSSRTPPVSAAKTSSPASSNAAEDPEASPSDERMASCSPCSPNKIKASSRL